MSVIWQCSNYQVLGKCWHISFQKCSGKFTARFRESIHFDEFAFVGISVVKCETITKLKMRRKFTACFWGSIHFDGFCSFCFSFTEMWVNHTYVDMEGSLSFVCIVATFSCAVHHFVGADVLRWVCVSFQDPKECTNVFQVYRYV
jgi:hypothetical protein